VQLRQTASGLAAHPALIGYICGNMLFPRALVRTFSTSAEKNRADYEAFLKKKKSNKLLQAGVPLILLVVAGSLFLSNFLTTQVELKDKGNQGKSERKFDLEEEHRKLLKSLDIDNYTLSRIPRPDDSEKK
jgi:hypothetical protein